MSIAILTPSRQRAEAFDEMVGAIASTADGQVTVLLGVDDDDESAYPREGFWREQVYVAPFRGSRAQLAEWTDRLARIALDEGFDILASFGDDHRPRTQGWDITVRVAMRDMGPGLVYTADGLQNDRLPTAPLWHRDIIEAWGFYFFPSCTHLYADDYWLYAAKALGRCTYLSDVMIEHMHPAAGKAEADAITRENDSYYTKDNQAYALWLSSPQQKQALERARAVL